MHQIVVLQDPNLDGDLLCYKIKTVRRRIAATRQAASAHRMPGQPGGFRA